MLGTTTFAVATLAFVFTRLPGLSIRIVLLLKVAKCLVRQPLLFAQGLGQTLHRLLARALLPGGEDQVHYAVGLGVGFDRFQIDLAVDLSERRDTVALSAIYSF